MFLKVVTGALAIYFSAANAQEVHPLDRQVGEFAKILQHLESVDPATPLRDLVTDQFYETLSDDAEVLHLFTWAMAEQGYPVNLTLDEQRAFDANPQDPLFQRVDELPFSGRGSQSIPSLLRRNKIFFVFQLRSQLKQPKRKLSGIGELYLKAIHAGLASYMGRLRQPSLSTLADLQPVGNAPSSLDIPVRAFAQVFNILDSMALEADWSQVQVRHLLTAEFYRRIQSEARLGELTQALAEMGLPMNLQPADLAQLEADPYHPRFHCLRSVRIETLHQPDLIAVLNNMNIHLVEDWLRWRQQPDQPCEGISQRVMRMTDARVSTYLVRAARETEVGLAHGTVGMRCLIF